MPERSKHARATARKRLSSVVRSDQEADRVDQRLGQAREPLGQQRVELGEREPVSDCRPRSMIVWTEGIILWPRASASSEA